METLIARGCVAKWSDVRGPDGPDRPRLIMALSVEETKPRLIYDARPLDQFFKRFPFSVDTVARVANVASEGCFMTSLDDSSAFHHILIHPASWPLLGFTYRGVDYVWCVLPFGLSISPSVYHTLSALSEAKAEHLRSLGIVALAYLDDSFLSNAVATHGAGDREQWLAACEGTHVAILVSYLCGVTPVGQEVRLVADSDPEVRGHPVRLRDLNLLRPAGEARRRAHPPHGGFGEPYRRVPDVETHRWQGYKQA